MHQRTATHEPARVALAIAFAAWGAAGLALALSGAIAAAPLLLPLWIGGTVTGAVVAYRRAPAIRAAVRALDRRALILAHLARVPIGAAILARAGEAPELFAHRAGPGDIAVGLAALAVAARPRRGLVVAWSALGLADLALAVGTAQYLFFVVHDPRMALVGALPWALLPTLAVPALALAHLALLARR